MTDRHPGGRGGPAVRRALRLLRVRCHRTWARLPAWIQQGNVYAWTLQQYVATPPGSDRAAVHAIYREAAQLRRRGYDVVVDHIEPLRSPWVCGLHVAANLRIVSRYENARKGNGSAHPDLFELEPSPHQMRLL